MTASTADKPSQLLSFKHCPKLLWYAHAGQTRIAEPLMLSAHSDMKLRWYALSQECGRACRLGTETCWAFSLNKQMNAYRPLRYSEAEE